MLIIVVIIFTIVLFTDKKETPTTEVSAPKVKTTESVPFYPCTDSKCP